jgi:hypothetical protein
VSPRQDDNQRISPNRHDLQENSSQHEPPPSARVNSCSAYYLSTTEFSRPNGLAYAKPLPYDPRATFEWAYQDASGATPLLIKRIDGEDFDLHGKRKKDFFPYRPDPKHPGKWLLGFEGKGLPRLPYRMPELIEARKAGRTILVHEGERCVDLCWHLGVAATCSPGGSGQARKLWPILAGYFKAPDRVVIVPDNDDPGREFCDTAATELRKAGVYAEVLKLPGLGDIVGGDLLDWYDRGGTAEQLEALIETEARPWKPGESVNAETPRQDSCREQETVPPPPIIRSAKALQHRVFEPMKYAVKGYVVEGVTILAGRPKIGKSWLALDWNGAVSRGGFCFGLLHCYRGAGFVSRPRRQRAPSKIASRQALWSHRMA